MLPRHVLAMLRDDGFDRAHPSASGAKTEADYRGLRVRVMSASKAAAYKPGPHEVAISIRGNTERPTLLSSKFVDVLELVFDDTGAFASYAMHGLDNPNSITPDQADAVAAFVNRHRDASALLINCAASISRSRSMAAAICNELELPYIWAAVNDDVYGKVTEAFSRSGSA